MNRVHIGSSGPILACLECAVPGKDLGDTRDPYGTVSRTIEVLPGADMADYVSPCVLCGSFTDAIRRYVVVRTHADLESAKARGLDERFVSVLDAQGRKEQRR